MKLSELIGAADHEVWFRVDEPDGRRHFFWTADVFGGHGPTLDELGPMEDMECDDFCLVMDTDPENGGTVPMVGVELMEVSNGKEK